MCWRGPHEHSICECGQVKQTRIKQGSRCTCCGSGCVVALGADFDVTADGLLSLLLVCWRGCCSPSYVRSALFHWKVQSRSVGQSTLGSKRAMLVVTQRKRPGVPHDKVNGTCAQPHPHDMVQGSMWLSYEA